MNHRSVEQHLEAGEVAAYVDQAVDGPARRAIESHLATCAQCRSEVVEVGGVVRTLPRGRQWRFWIPAAAAAAAVLLMWASPSVAPDAPQVVHRDEAVTLTPAPRLLHAEGPGSAPMATWSAVPTADRYRIRLFDGAGAVLWMRETVDTVAVLPDSVSLRPGTPYYWKVESHSGFGRWSGSELVEFVPRRNRDP